MAGLSIVTWHWGDKYSVGYIEKLAAGLKRHMAEPYELICFSENPIDVDGIENYPIHFEDLYLTKVQGCFVRLRLFDPAFQASYQLGDRIVCIDLDAVVCGALYPLFHRPEPFMILQGANAQNPCPYNGSVWMLRAGYRPDVWSDFTLEKARRVPFHEFPDDQGWFADKIPNAPGWRAGAASGVYAFKKPGWPSGDALPKDARMVVFPGYRDPAHFVDLPWVQYHWAA